MATPNTETSIFDRSETANSPWLRDLATNLGHDLRQGPLRVGGVEIDEELAAALDHIAEHGPVHGSPLE